MVAAKNDSTPFFKLALKTTAFLVTMFFFVLPASAQNSKGDKPAANPSGPFLRIPKKLFKSKSPDKAYTKDITGRRRIRTRNSSSAKRASYATPDPYKDRKYKKKGDRPAQLNARYFAPRPPRTGERPYRGNMQGKPLRIRSVSAKRAKHNVYPNRGLYVNNPAQRPHGTEHAAQRNVHGVRIKNRPPTRSFGMRGRKDVYWGKFSKGERPFVKDLTGRDVRTKNFMSGGTGIGNSDTMRFAHRRPGREQLGRARKKAIVSLPGTRRNGWTGDISGHKLRTRSPRSSGARFGLSELDFKFGSPPRGKKSNAPLPSRAASINTSAFTRALNKLTGRRPGSGGGSRSAKFNSNGKPLPGKGPMGSAGLGAFGGKFKTRRPLHGGGSATGKFRGDGKPLIGRGPGNTAMFGFAGSYKARRPLKGGGSVTGKFRGDGKPLIGRVPGNTSMFGFAGTFKTRRPLKGGGSVTGKFRGDGKPLVGRTPGNTAMFGFAGNYKARRPLKGGGSVTGKFRGDGKPLIGRGPGNTAMFGFAGTYKTRRPQKGGGSVTGKFRANGNPVIVRGPGMGADGMANFRGNFRQGELSPGISHGGYGWSGNMRARKKPDGKAQSGFRGKFHTGDLWYGLGRQGYGWAGNDKTRRPAKGGGSITGANLKRNREALPPTGGGKDFHTMASFQGKFRRTQLQKDFGRQGYGWAGSTRAKRPAKGGGTISGKMLSNGGKPVEVRTGAPGSAKVGRWQGNFKQGELWYGFNDDYVGWKGNTKQQKPVRDAKGSHYSGKIALSFFKRHYIQNPKANEESLKKKKPTPNTFLASGLQVKEKQGKYIRKPHAADGSLKGIGPKQSTVKASEYARAMKMYWSYRHNPSSNDAAMDTRRPKSGWGRATQFSGNTRMARNFRHNPRSNRDALKDFYPGKAYARINDFAGNLKMYKNADGRMHPDTRFAHGFRDNVKGERTVIMNFKLFWAKLFKKNDGQPAIVKEKEHKPRYDRKEKDLWKALYD